jgi:hypothetical protein
MNIVRLKYIPRDETGSLYFLATFSFFTIFMNMVTAQSTDSPSPHLTTVLNLTRNIFDVMYDRSIIYTVSTS